MRPKSRVWVPVDRARVDAEDSGRGTVDARDLAGTKWTFHGSCLLIDGSG